MSVLTVYTAPGCHLCGEALVALRALRDELGFELLERDITRDDALHRAYLERIPVVEVDGEEVCEYIVDASVVRARVRARHRSAESDMTGAENDSAENMPGLENAMPGPENGVSGPGVRTGLGRVTGE